MKLVPKVLDRPASIIDCDPGLDDAVALFVALAHTNVLGVTVTYGNCSVETGVQNALDLLALAGRSDIPVARGSDRPLFCALPPDSVLHAPNGLGGLTLPRSKTHPSPDRAATFIYEMVQRSTEPVTLIAMGPLTNIAIAFATYPDLIERIAGITMAGGSLTFGDVAPVAEFNMHADPEAARVVFRSGVPIRMCGLNVTQFAHVSREGAAILAEEPSNISRFVASIIDVREQRMRDNYDTDVSSLNDACAVFALTHPGIFRFNVMAVDVETKGELTRGMTVCDNRLLKVADKGEIEAERAHPNVAVATEIIGDFEMHVVEAIRGIGQF